MKQFLQQRVLSYLRFWARKALAKHHPVIIGIAGSVGKSSTRNALEAILKDHFPTVSVGNSETGIPLGILGMKPEDYTKIDWAKMLVRAPFSLNFLKGTKYLIAEMGIDDPFPPKNMGYLLTILKPDIAISLNVSATHTMQFEKALPKKEYTEKERLEAAIKKIAEEDTKIITQSDCKTGICNADDENIMATIKQSNNDSNQDLLTFGSKSSNAISYGLYKVSLQGTSFQFYLKDQESKDLTLTLAHHLLPREYREVFAAAILAALQTGLHLEQIKGSLEQNYTLPKGRSSLFHGINDTVIIDSTYNASKVAVEAFLELVDTIKKETKRPVVFLFGDMRELGAESKIEHEAVAQKLLGIVDYLYLVGPQTREFILPVVQQQEERLKEIRWFDTSMRAGDYLKDNLPKNAIVLAKGSQNTIFLEEAVKQILADKKDSRNLCRQDAFWMKVKQ
jgi:UDP-N-acetylmuramyl pentapeptide synthase